MMPEKGKICCLYTFSNLQNLITYTNSACLWVPLDISLFQLTRISITHKVKYLNPKIIWSPLIFRLNFGLFINVSLLLLSDLNLGIIMHVKIVLTGVVNLSERPKYQRLEQHCFGV